MQLPGKELLAEVLFSRQKLEWVSKKSNANFLYYKEDNLNGESNINIYELMYLCKQWAYKADEYVIDSGMEYALLYDRYACSDDEPNYTFNANTEPEAVFEASQYILAQLPKDNT